MGSDVAELLLVILLISQCSQCSDLENMEDKLKAIKAETRECVREMELHSINCCDVVDFYPGPRDPRKEDSRNKSIQVYRQ